MASKKRIRDKFSAIDLNTLEGLKRSVDAALAAMQSGEWQELEPDTEYYCREDNVGDWVFRGLRWETDKELAKRLAQEERSAKRRIKEKESKAAAELKEYRRLKKKFEGSSK